MLHSVSCYAIVRQIRLNQNSSSKKIFNESKKEYEEALKESGYKNFELKYNPEKQKPKKQQKQKKKYYLVQPTFQQKRHHKHR